MNFQKGDKDVVKLKICGLKTPQDIALVNNFQPDYVGFVLASSKRQVSLETAYHLKSLLVPGIRAVGVFVNEPLNSIMEYIAQDIIDYVQLHGDENLAYIKALKEEGRIPIIKAIRVKNQEAFTKEQRRLMESEWLDYPLFDTYSPTAYGGSGVSFNWESLKDVKRPYFLAGGINANNIREAIDLAPYAIDVSSGVEVEGSKDAIKIKELLMKMKT